MEGKDGSEPRQVPHEYTEEEGCRHNTESDGTFRLGPRCVEGETTQFGPCQLRTPRPTVALTSSFGPTVVTVRRGVPLHVVAEDGGILQTQSRGVPPIPLRERDMGVGVPRTHLNRSN